MPCGRLDARQPQGEPLPISNGTALIQRLFALDHWRKALDISSAGRGRGKLVQPL